MLKMKGKINTIRKNICWAQHWTFYKNLSDLSFSIIISIELKKKVTNNFYLLGIFWKISE